MKTLRSRNLPRIPQPAHGRAWIQTWSVWLQHQAYKTIMPATPLSCSQAEVPLPCRPSPARPSPKLLIGIAIPSVSSLSGNWTGSFQSSPQNVHLPWEACILHIMVPWSLVAMYSNVSAQFGTPEAVSPLLIVLAPWPAWGTRLLPLSPASLLWEQRAPEPNHWDKSFKGREQEMETSRLIAGQQTGWLIPKGKP